MQNEADWRPTKYVRRGGVWRANAVSASSRLIVDCVGRAVVPMIERPAHGRFLDLGCGKAPFAGAYKPLASTVTCVDWNAGRYVDFTHDLTKPLPFDDDSFDTVLLSDVLEHIPTPELLCREIGRILAPQGNLIANTPFLYWLHETPHDYYRYTEYALRRLMADAGLQVVEMQPIGGAPEVLADLVSKCVVRAPGGNFAAAAIQAIAWRFAGG